MSGCLILRSNRGQKNPGRREPAVATTETDSEPIAATETGQKTFVDIAKNILPSQTSAHPLFYLIPIGSAFS